MVGGGGGGAEQLAVQLKMSNLADAEALVEVYLSGKWTDIMPQGYHEEGGRLRWMVLLPPRATKTLSCRAKRADAPRGDK